MFCKFIGGETTHHRCLVLVLLLFKLIFYIWSSKERLENSDMLFCCMQQEFLHGAILSIDVAFSSPLQSHLKLSIVNFNIRIENATNLTVLNYTSFLENRIYLALLQNMHHFYVEWLSQGRHKTILKINTSHCCELRILLCYCIYYSSS